MQKLKTGGFLYAAVVAGVLGLSAVSLAQPVQPQPAYPMNGTSTAPSTRHTPQMPAQTEHSTSGKKQSAPGNGHRRAEAQGKMAGDPPQWHKEDATREHQYQTARKEANAAYAQATAHCRTLSASERTTCLAEARTAYNEDLAALKREYGK